MMPVGSKWELYIPYNLAYGERGAGNKIKPYSALVFTVEMVGVKKASVPVIKRDKNTEDKGKVVKTAKQKPVVKTAKTK